jgi:hypothetical protein
LSSVEGKDKERGERTHIETVELPPLGVEAALVAEAEGVGLADMAWV